MNELDVNSAIAREIMTPFVIMLEKDATFKEVVDTLTNNHITAVFIFDKEVNEYYIISQAIITEFLSKIGLKCGDLSKLSVSRIMKGPIETVDIDTPVDKVIRFMAKKNYKRVLISEEEKATGVISTRDIMMWNNTYFKQAKPQILLFIDNKNSCLIAQHIFEENLQDDVEQELISIYGGALKAISIITEEVIKRSGKLYHLHNDKRSILVESYKELMGVLICDYNSIDLRRKLKLACRKFYEMHSDVINNAACLTGVNVRLDLGDIFTIFQ